MMHHHRKRFLQGALLMFLSGYVVCTERKAMLEAKFIASNAVQVQVCVPIPRIQHTQFDVNFTLTSETDGVIQYHSSSVKHIHKAGETCKSSVLWFTKSSTSFSANLTLDAYIVLTNSSHQPWRGVFNLERQAHHPPVVDKVNLYRYEGELYKTIPGPHINATVPKPVAFIVKVDMYTIQCLVKGFPKPSIAWYKDTVHVGDGPWYNVTEPGYYKCEAKNPYGTSYSHNIHFKQTYFGNFVNIREPKKLTYETGRGVEMACEGPPCFPACGVNWITTTEPEGLEGMTLLKVDNKRTFITEEGMLILLNSHPSDNTYYRCVVRERTETMVSKYGRTQNLSVRPTDKVKYGQMRLLYKSKEMHIAVRGETYKMYCIFTGPPLVYVTWYKDNVKLETTSAMLMIENITQAHAGMYECKGTDGQTQKKSDRYAITHLRVEYPPTINNGLGLHPIVAVRGSDIVVTCNAMGEPLPKVQVNQTESNVVSNYHVSSNRLKITKATMQNIGIVSCNATNLVGYTYSSTFINITEPTVITNNLMDVHLDNSTIEKTCEAETDPNTILQIYWYKRGNRLTTDHKLGLVINGNTLNIHAKKDERNYYGEYICMATNGISSANKSFHIFPKMYSSPVKELSDPHFTQAPLFVAAVSVGVGILLVLLAIAVAIVYRSKHKDTLLPRSRLSTFSDASSFPTSHHSEAGLTDHLEAAAMIYANRSQLDPFDRCSDPMQRVSDPKLRLTVGEVFIERERIQMNELIGKGTKFYCNEFSGQFGRVYLAVLFTEKRTDKYKVAVKTLKYKADESDVVDYFLEEAIIMKNFTHPHVLSLTGISFEEDGSPMVVLPYMSNGDLRNYIQDPNKDITVLELLKLGLQVAQGMAYLSARKYVHRDLACRNCMVDDKNTVKVADFGLSRNLFSRDYYREACGKRPLPVRWMAPECHKNNMFTTSSDAWSFGILLWELMTRGAVPYPNIENWNVSAHVVAGNKLPQPNYCPTSVYKIMLSCWEEPPQRTPFPQIVQDIEDIVHTANTNAEESESFYINIHRTEEPDYRVNNNNNNTTVV